MSNFPAWMVVDVWHRCKAKGMVLPTVYQGMYNGITRDFEREVVPVLRQFLWCRAKVKDSGSSARIQSYLQPLRMSVRPHSYFGTALSARRKVAFVV